MAITKGMTVGPYEVLAQIGVGGMGEVWRARDKRIGRDVAIKVMPDVAVAEEQVRRFEQEARAAGALNHPGLVTIYDVGRTDGFPYIVMELLEGETLREVIGDPVPAPMPLRKALDYAIQAASALAVAHDKGIIHRDLKPENFFVTSEGRVKILDFGLAKLAQDAKDDERGKTGRHFTSTGMVVGTPGYMSPEQVRAKPLDHRTDIFSLGSVLYEMLSGRRAFDRDSAVETMTAVLNEEPPPLPELVPAVSQGLEAIVRHCMEKNPRERFQSAQDLAFHMRVLPELQQGATDKYRPLSTAASEPEKKRRLPYIVSALALSLLALAGGGFAIFRGRSQASSQPSAMFRQLTFNDGLNMSPALSPDGKTLAYVSARSGNLDIYVQRVDGRVAQNITADSPVDDSEPAFSPDGSQIAFRSEREGGGIFLMGVTGESVRRLTHFGHNPSWSPDGARIAIATEAAGLAPQVHPRDSELWIVDAKSGAARPILQLTKNAVQSDALQPSWSPHGKRIAFWGIHRGESQRDIWTIDPDSAQPSLTIVSVTSDPALDWNPVWSLDGTYLYFGSDRSGTLNLWRIPIDEETGQTTGNPEPATLPATVSGDFAFSQQGEMAYGTVSRTFRVMAIPFDERSGKTGTPRPLFGGSDDIGEFAPSPDQRSIAFTTVGRQEDLFIIDAEGKRVRQMTNDAPKDRGVSWSPDGETLYFYSDRGGRYNLWSMRKDGSQLAPVVDDATLKRSGLTALYSPTPSPDGRMLVALTNRSAVLVHLDRPLPQRLEPLQDFPAKWAAWSPDGKRIAGSMSGGGIGIYSLETHHVDMLLNYGVVPQWLSDGKHLLFFDKAGLHILDLDTRRISTETVSIPGVAWDDDTVSHHLSRDHTTLYVCQTIEQGDIWMARFKAQ
ncbi:MAG TPA: protein kinase [Thermoanaerobaculia bacterium]|nr:protein kinase [Thermoanaerobaculia bacterium]